MIESLQKELPNQQRATLFATLGVPHQIKQLVTSAFS